MTKISSNKEITLKEIVDEMNGRGHAPMFARGNSIPKDLVETQTAREWANSLRAIGGPLIEDIHEGSDPPDCFGNLAGSKMSIELTEFVDSAALKRLCRNPISQMTLAESRKHFDQTQWTSARFQNELAECLDRKTRKYARNNIEIDFLIVHTDEPWLHPQSVEVWLKQITVASRKQISNAYFLMTYMPGYAEHWPLFRLFGNI